MTKCKKIFLNMDEIFENLEMCPKVLKICPIYLKFFKFSRDDKNLKISQKY
jgi:hypothetical protein